MRFVPTPEQTDFVGALDRLLTGADTVGAARAWADGKHEPGLTIWSRLAEQGVTALLVDEQRGGLGASAVEVVLALEALGRHVVPGPWVESVAHLPTAAPDSDLAAAVAEGAVATVAAPPHTPYALDADVAAHVLAAVPEGLVAARIGQGRQSVDRTRHLFEVHADGPSTASATLDTAFDMAALATAAELLGAGERILADTVAHARQRRQFGREIGSYQAVKHALADVRIALDFARPLVHGAAVTAGDPGWSRSVSAAKASAADAAHRAARTGLQVHGAVGYTTELDLSLWLTRVRALIPAWGTPAWHRARILDSLVGARDGEAVPR